MNFIKSITKKDIFYIIIIAMVLFLGGCFFNNKMNTLNAKYDNYENTIKALNDSIHVSIKNGFTEYSKAAPEIYLDQLTNSEAFKSLAADQKKYYLELSKVKGLVSSTYAELQKQGTDIASLKGINPGTIKGDSISYKLGSELAFAQEDTSKALKWSGKLKLSAKPTFTLNYDYKFNIQSSFVRNKDKTIVVNYKINDPELKVEKMFNYIIPAEQKRTKLGRWFERNKATIYGVGAGAIFSAGGYVGYKLAK